ncbi:MAG: hypothetical protein AAGC93_05425 [Cyanobacteria bacterium P01_F01_bin.53]
MKQIKRQVFGSLGLATIAAFSIAPESSAVGFTFTAVQERKDEVVVIDDIIANFQALEQARLDERHAEAEATTEATAQTQENNAVARLPIAQ